MTLLPSTSEDTPSPFSVGDCSLMTIATGMKAQNLREFRDGLMHAPESCLRHHFWGRLLSPRFDEPEYSNDFASWAHRGLHEKALAERLSAVEPTAHDDVESLRQNLVEVVEKTLDAHETVPWAQSDQLFYFLRGKIIVFDTGKRIGHPSEFTESVAHMSTSSIYYHFIDARHRTPRRCDDFSMWLEAWGPSYEELMFRIQAIDPFFSSLKEIRRVILDVCIRSDVLRVDA